MNQELICNHLDEKAIEFLSLFPTPLREKVASKMYFAGGCIYCANNDKQIKDYDIFLTDQTISREIETLDFWAYKTEYALTRGKFQLVTKYFGIPCDCVGQFDFKHNMYYYIPFSGLIKSANIEECEKQFHEFEYICTNELIFNETRARDIEGVYLRIKKFEDRGMRISKSDKKRIKSRTTKKAVRKYKKSRRGGSGNY